MWGRGEGVLQAKGGVAAILCLLQGLEVPQQDVPQPLDIHARNLSLFGFLVLSTSWYILVGVGGRENTFIRVIDVQVCTSVNTNQPTLAHTGRGRDGSAELIGKEVSM